MIRTAALIPAIALGSGCAIPEPQLPDAGPPPDEPALGTRENPAWSCRQLWDDGAISGRYWIVHPSGGSPPLEVYCEQDYMEGGWALVFNSVLTAGETTAFWQLRHRERFIDKGQASLDENCYRGALYRRGVEYLDVVVDMRGQQRLAFSAKATGIDSNTMRFIDPEFVSGVELLYTLHFASGWSSYDLDGDTLATRNCAVEYNDVAQHYGNCWGYNLGSDGDGMPASADGGVGPHVSNNFLMELGLEGEIGGEEYSRVSRITRFARW